MKGGHCNTSSVQEKKAFKRISHCGNLIFACQGYKGFVQISDVDVLVVSALLTLLFVVQV